MGSQMFWSVVKPMIPGRTLHRIHFYGTDYQEELLKYIAPENLPVRGRAGTLPFS